MVAENTPIREQYLRIKNQNPDTILLFQMGDFYETFDEDAKIASMVLEIVYTSREMGKGNQIPMAGIPKHALDNYLPKLIKNGHRVAICDQTGDSTEKGLVEREVVRVVTAGTLTETSMLETSDNNFLAAVVFDENLVGLSYVDITTNEFATTQIHRKDLPMELSRLHPAEIILLDDTDLSEVGTEFITTVVDAGSAIVADCEMHVKKHFGVQSLESYGCHDMPLAIGSAALILFYLENTDKYVLDGLNSLFTYFPSNFMVLDNQSRNSLELYISGRWGGERNSLLSLLDMTKTSMGGRLFKKWIGQPLLDLNELNSRHDGVEFLLNSILVRDQIGFYLKDIYDIERLINRIGSGSVSVRDLVSLESTLFAVAGLKDFLNKQKSLPHILQQYLDPCETVQSLILKSIENIESTTSGSHGLIRRGFSAELDFLKDDSSAARDYIAGLEKTERDRTVINSLKVGYNRVFGYYLEVNNSSIGQVPNNYTRRQTLTGAERYITPELKEYEAKLLNAQDKIDELESTLFRKICEDIYEHKDSIESTALSVAKIDVVLSLSLVASEYRYSRPRLNTGNILDVKQARHPIVEHNVSLGSFVPNDILIGGDNGRISIITGPNMAGKSTYIRQVALIVLMAQIGSFVPAASADIGIVDRIFTRIGLQDDLSVGQSTFMVEMIETANILNHATNKSLIILDEIGRGTSTYDGLAIARATVEYIHSNEKLNCRTLFATHYHELIELSDIFPCVNNLNISAKESNGRLSFMYTVMQGGADRSYGINVAQLAGMPRDLVIRAWEILKKLEIENQGVVQKQLPMFEIPDPIILSIKSLDIESMTPIEAMNKLNELKSQIRQYEQSE